MVISSSTTRGLVACKRSAHSRSPLNGNTDFALVSRMYQVPESEIFNDEHINELCSNELVEKKSEQHRHHCGVQSSWSVILHWLSSLNKPTTKSLDLFFTTSMLRPMRTDWLYYLIERNLRNTTYQRLSTWIFLTSWCVAPPKWAKKSSN